jgi:multiple sugar transport system substrate-binding protein
MRQLRVLQRSRRALLTGLVLAVALAGCGSGSDTSDDTGTSGGRKPGEKIEMTFWSWVPGVDKAVALWNSKNPEVQVKL